MNYVSEFSSMSECLIQIQAHSSLILNVREEWTHFLLILNFFLYYSIVQKHTCSRNRRKLQIYAIISNENKWEQYLLALTKIVTNYWRFVFNGCKQFPFFKWIIFFQSFVCISSRVFIFRGRSFLSFHCKRCMAGESLQGHLNFEFEFNWSLTDDVDIFLNPQKIAKKLLKPCRKSWTKEECKAHNSLLR